MTQHIPSLPQNIDSRIADILKRRAEQGTVLTKTVPAQPRARAQSLPQPPVHGLDTEAPREQPLDDAELAGLLDGVLPRIDALVREAIRGVRPRLRKAPAPTS